MIKIVLKNYFLHNNTYKSLVISISNLQHKYENTNKIFGK